VHLDTTRRTLKANAYIPGINQPHTISRIYIYNTHKSFSKHSDFASDDWIKAFCHTHLNVRKSPGPGMHKIQLQHNKRNKHRIGTHTVHNLLNN